MKLHGHLDLLASSPHCWHEWARIFYFQPKKGGISHICHTSKNKTTLQDQVGAANMHNKTSTVTTKWHCVEQNQLTSHCLHCFGSEWQLRFEATVKKTVIQDILRRWFGSSVNLSTWHTCWCWWGCECNTQCGVQNKYECVGLSKQVLGQQSYQIYNAIWTYNWIFFFNTYAMLLNDYHIRILHHDTPK